MSRASSWDAIAIGSGLGSLTAAAALAKQGLRVLVLERLSNFGGAATLYRHGGLTMEASLHETDGATVYGPHGVFARLGLQGQVSPVKTEIFYEIRGGPIPNPVRIPHGLSAAEAAVIAACPASQDALARHFEDLRRLHHSLSDLEDMGARGPGALLGTVFSGRLFELIAQTRRTLLEEHDRALGDDEIAKLILGGLMAYFDDDPAQLSFVLYAGVWSRYVEEGSYYFDGGSRALTFALLKQLTTGGGEARRSCSVEDILLDDAGRAIGVAYVEEGGGKREAYARVILGGAAPERLAAMLPDPVGQAMRDRYDAHDPSISLFNISLGLNAPAERFGVSAYSTFILPDDLTRFADFPLACARFGAEPADALPPYVIADYGRLDAGIRKQGDPYLVSLCGADRFAWWRALSEEQEMARREAWIERLLADADRRYPGFAAAVVHKEIAVSRTMRNRLGTPEGEVYGFRPTPQRLFSRPPKAATPVPGLFLSSAYTVSGGYAGAMHGGLMAADAAARVLRR